MSDDPERDERIAYMINNLQQLEQGRWEFANKYGFAYKRVQDYKNCLVIRWPHRKKKKDKNYIDHDRIQVMVNVAHALRDKYGAWDEKHMLLSSDDVFHTIGVYSHHSFTKVWAIPNEFKEVQEFVLSRLPDWAVVRNK